MENGTKNCADSIAEGSIESSICVRIASSAKEIDAAKRLRYKVFYEEFSAIADDATRKSGKDSDIFDEVSDHLVVLDGEEVVGTYRLLRQEKMQELGRFYTASEYDITLLLDSGKNMLEFGRSCVLAPYRTRDVMKMLWKGIAHYVADNNIELMFGCASIMSTDTEAIKKELSYLHHYHLAEENIRPTALGEYFVDMDIVPKDKIDARRVFVSLPPLVKGYLRLGAAVGYGAVIDRQFGTTDVCIVLPTENVTERYVRHYERVTNKVIVSR